MSTKVFAVIGSWDFEGHTTPLGIFTDWDMAVECQDRNTKNYDEVEIYAYHLDVDGDGTLC